MKTYLFSLVFVIFVFNVQQVSAQQLETKINESLQESTTRLVGEFDQISQSRKDQLTKIGDFLVSNVSDTATFSVLFVCTHNSRRSHIADTWFKYGMLYFGVDRFESYSGGLESTAFNPNAIDALERVGFSVTYNKKVDNSIVSISPGSFPVWKMKSKVYSHNVNPKSNFAAVMVCSDADKSCPLVMGAEGRFSLPYDDPKYYDNTPSQKLKYDEAVSLIGREMLFLTSYLKTKTITDIESSK